MTRRGGEGEGPLGREGESPEWSGVARWARGRDGEELPEDNSKMLCFSKIRRVSSLTGGSLI